MFTYQFAIAGLKVCLRSAYPCVFDHLAPFFAPQDQEGDLLIDCVALNTRDDKRLLYAEQKRFFWYALPEQGYRLEFAPPYPDGIQAAMEVDRQWRNAVLQGDNKSGCLLEGPLGEVLFRCAMIGRGGVQIHSAAINRAGKGILFSAPSGLGKTTQAHLWVKHCGATMLNGDRPLVRLADDEALVCGTPWSGSDPVYRNEQLPLGAIVFLERSLENRVEELSNEQAVNRIMPRCFLPYFSTEMMGEALTNLESILRRVPCYLLYCKPERAAAELLEKALAPALGCIS